MILIYASNNDLGKVTDFVESLEKEGKRFSYRNPQYFDKPEPCDGVYIEGEWTAVREAYDTIIESVEPNLDYPKHISDNGWYELSNGETVRGKDKAIEAQKELDNG